VKACLFIGPYNLRVDDVARPRISDNDVLVKVSLAGICGSDLEIYRGRRQVKTPIVLGHEAVGVVEEVGKNVEGVSVGDRVVIEPNIYCGRCYYCRRGLMNICENKIIYGVTRNGVFAEYVDVPSKFVWKVPNHVPDDVAVLIEPLSVVLRAVRHLNLLPSDSVLVIGGGSIGALTALLLQYMRVNVVVTDVLPTRIKLLKDVGINEAVNIHEEKADEVLKGLLGDKYADYVIDTVGTSSSFTQVFKYVRPGGRVVALGLMSHKAEIDPFQLVRNTLRIEGSLIYIGDYYDAIKLVSRADFADMLRRVVTHRFSLEECGEAFKVAESGEGLKVALKP